VKDKPRHQRDRSRVKPAPPPPSEAKRNARTPPKKPLGRELRDAKRADKIGMDRNHELGLPENSTNANSARPWGAHQLAGCTDP